MAQSSSTLSLQGGLNVVTPEIFKNAGHLIAVQNYESDIRGTRRVIGYESFDGQARPSQANYWVLDYTAGTAAISSGDTVTGASSGATGKAIVDSVISSGSYGGSDAAGYLVLTNVVGTFTASEALNVSGASKSNAVADALQTGAENDTDDAAWQQAAITAQRALIAKPSGEGAIRGVFELKGEKYCIRDNVGATAGVLFKATTSGWSAVTLSSYIKFDTGNGTINEGDTITGGTSSATATIKRLITSNGAYDGSALGIFVLETISGTFQDNETLTAASGGTAAANGVIVVPTLDAGGRYSFITNNFYGSTNRTSIYGASGAGRAFEFDGETFAPIFVYGLTDALDKPQRVAELNSHLILTFAGGSIQISETGYPLQFRAIGGAVELGFGDDINDIEGSVSTAVIIIGSRKIGYLTGTSSANFVLSDITDDSGGKAYTAQNIGGLMYLDDGGVRKVSSTQSYGDFNTATVTEQITPLIEKKVADGILPVASMRVKARNLYRLFFDDGAVLSVYFRGNKSEPMFLLYDFTAKCTFTGENADGSEILLVGAEDGHVYELDRGTSFDGAIIYAYGRTAFNHFGSPNHIKKFSTARLEIDGPQNANIGLTTETAYGSDFNPSGGFQNFDIKGSGGFWNEAEWDRFVWSAQYVGSAKARIPSRGENISMTFISESATEEPHTLSSLTIDFTKRKPTR
jgi:hypothetical protein